MVVIILVKFYGLNEVGVIEEGYWVDLCFIDVKGYLVCVIYWGEVV